MMSSTNSNNTSNEGTDNNEAARKNMDHKPHDKDESRRPNQNEKKSHPLDDEGDIG